MAAGGFIVRLIGTVCGMLAGLALLAPLGSATAAEFKYVESFGSDGSETVGFSTAGAIAVDQEADVVYVVDRGAGTLLKFDLEGNPVPFGGSAGYINGNEISGFSLGGGAGERQVAVDPATHTIYVTGEASKALLAFQPDGEPALFSAGPGAGTNKIEGFFELLGVAVDANGAIYASDYGPVGDGTISVYSQAGEFLTELDILGPANVAVDSEGTLYVNRYRSTVVAYTPSVFPVTSATTYAAASEPLNTAASLSVYVDPATDEVYVAESAPARIAVFDSGGTFRTSFGGPGEEGELASAEGIAVDSDSERAFAANAPEGGLSLVEIFQRERVVDKPTIGTLAVDEVTANTARLRAQINPNTRATTYRFEYGLGDCAVSACVSVPVGGAAIGSGFNLVSVSQTVSGLQAGATYHYRLVAQNNLGTSEADGTFRTQGNGLGFLLGDQRVWEMVSPSDKFGGDIINSTLGPIQASDSGDGLVYLTRGSIVAQPEGNRSPDVATALAKREGGGLWRSRDLTPPHSRASQAVGDGEYNTFSPDLSRGEMEPRDDYPLSIESSEQSPYLWRDAEPGSFQPLVTSKEPFANVPPGTKFGEVLGQVYNPIRMEAANPSLTHIVIRSEAVPLIEGAEPGALYMWSNGDLEAVSEIPEDEGAEGGEIVQAMAGSGRGSVRHAVSNGGSRVFWTPGVDYGEAGIGLPALYLRDTQRDETTRLDVVQPGGNDTNPSLPAFQGASDDGSVVFFSDSRQLTAGASPTGRDLYRCAVGLVGDSLGCVSLTNLTGPLAGPGESTGFIDPASALADDGKSIYFVARGVLDDAPNAAGDSATSGEPNLYLWREGEGVRFVARLSALDYGNWGAKPTLQEIGFEAYLTATASPGGRYLAFMSERSLTGYENRNSEGELTSQVFVYDAAADELTCASCNPTGAAAVGQLLPPSEEANQIPPADPGKLWANRWVAAILPQASENQPLGRVFYRPRSVLDNGRVYFNAVDPLVAGDSNGRWDVYQYQPIGVGGCTSSSGGPAVSLAGNACVSLLSSGTDSGDASFLDASASGDDVFFLTEGRLSVLDRDDAPDVYDARVNGTAAVLNPSAGCVGEGCRPATAPPVDPIPGSEAFRGPGNAIKCPKGKRKVRSLGKVRCIPRKRHQHRGKHKKHRQGNQQGGATR